MRIGLQVMLVCTIATMLGTAFNAEAGPKWELSEDSDSWMKLSFLGQVHGSYEEDADPETDIFLRRARVILSGQVTDGVRFFVETDNDNAGKSGAPSASTDIQDAFIDVRLGNSAHWIQAGLVLLPFSFENRSSATSLIGNDFNSETVKLVNTFVWRDYGAELYGNFGKRVAYCVGAFDGYDSDTGNKNPDANLRYTGHVAVNLVGEVETGWFYAQDKQGKSQYLAIGAGVDGQDKATLTMSEDETAPGVVDDHTAWVVDVQSGFSVGPAAMTINAAYYDWDNAIFEGNTAFVESGVLVGKNMVTGKCSVQNPDEGEDTVDYTTGIHHFVKGHNARAGVEYRWGDSNNKVLLGIQVLL